MNNSKPSWNEIYRNVAHVYDRDDELITISRETARLALSALRQIMADEAYHNQMAAAFELQKVLDD